VKSLRDSALRRLLGAQRAGDDGCARVRALVPPLHRRLCRSIARSCPRRECDGRRRGVLQHMSRRTRPEGTLDWRMNPTRDPFVRIIQNRGLFINSWIVIFVRDPNQGSFCKYTERQLVLLRPSRRCRRRDPLAPPRSVPLYSSSIKSMFPPTTSSLAHGLSGDASAAAPMGLERSGRGRRGIQLRLLPPRDAAYT
jgi:hypothetical protein